MKIFLILAQKKATLWLNATLKSSTDSYMAGIKLYQKMTQKQKKMTLFIVHDGIINACVTNKSGSRIFNTNYYSITYNFIRNEGYVEKKSENKWKLYTQIGQEIGETRYFYFSTFQECISKLQNLKGDNNTRVINQKELSEILIR